MNFISICSGIEAASVAFAPLGWNAIAFSEIDPFPCAVLAHHYPDVPNFGDMTKFRDWPEEIFSNGDVIVGGPPCQAFSVAGLRNGLSDSRGNLTITYAELIDYADEIRIRHGKPPVVVLYENVPGLLSDKSGAFGCFLAGLAGEAEPLEPAGGKWTNAGYVLGPKRAVAWRVLDAQYFGVAQRRRRVFVVASARDWFDPAAVLFEFDGVRRDIAPSREAGEKPAGTFNARASAGGGFSTDFECDGGFITAIHPHCIGRKPENGPQGKEYISDGSAYCMDSRGQPQAIVVHGTQDPCVSDIAFAQGRNNGGENAVLTVSLRGRDGGATAELGDEVGNCLRASGGGGDKAHVLAPVATRDCAGTLTSNYGKQCDNSDTALGPNVAIQVTQVRRLTPTECERLQGFPDGYSQIPWRKKPASDCPDGPRYKALGNSWAVPNVRWIGLRINAAVNVINQSKKVAA